jgi:transcriptional regulator with XRE-family HTH domain
VVKQGRGALLRAAARKRHLGAYKLAQLVGVYPQTIYDWWADKYQPEPRRLRAYAAALGATMDELGGDDAVQAEAETLAAEILVVTFGEIAQGAEPAAAFERASRGTRVFSEKERGVLDPAAPRVRDYLNQLAGGDWAGLPAAKKLALVERLMAPPPSPVDAAPPSAPPEPTTP